MVVGFMVKFSGTVMDLLLPWILAYIIDEVVPEADIARVVQWGLVMVVCAFIACGTRQCDSKQNGFISCERFNACFKK